MLDVMKFLVAQFAAAREEIGTALGVERENYLLAVVAETIRSKRLASTDGLRPSSH